MSNTIYITEKDVWTNILQIYRDSPHLWNKKHEDYLNRFMRQEGFKTLLGIYKEYDKNANMEFLKKKMENKRATYFRELKKVRTSKERGLNYVPALWYYELFSFFEDTTSCDRDLNTAMNNLDEDDTSSDGQSSNQASIDEQSSKRRSSEQHLPQMQNSKTAQTALKPTISTKKTRLSVPKKQEQVIKSEPNVLNLKEGEWDIVGKSIGIHLKDLDRHQLTITHKIISDAIFYAKMGKLNEESFIQLRPPSPVPVVLSAPPSPATSHCNYLD